jgi:outer membrane protein assembly factor BamB
MKKPLRLWPGVAAATVLFVMWYIAANVLPSARETGQIAGFGSALVIVIWWLFFSRARWMERIAALVLMAIAAIATRPLMHISIAGGAMGALPYALAIPPACLALVAWAVAARPWSDAGRRLASLAAFLLIASASTALLRTDGVGGGTLFQLQWRWTPTAEQSLLSEVKDEPAAEEPSPVAPTSTSGSNAKPEETPASPSAAPRPPSEAETTAPPISARAPEWPGFRGPDRSGVVRGVRIDTNWSASPPVQLWRRRIGPGWSSFAVDGNLFYTQEQRGDEEIVACYHVSTGEPVWRHRDHVRFYESNGGAGPRGTPTISNARVYSLGATGILNALDARTGAVVWSRNASSDTRVEVPMWGFSSSPLVIDQVVIVATSGTLAGYDAATGRLRWVGPHNGVSYSSPHLVTIDGVQQAVLLSGKVTSVAPADGKIVWQQEWEGGAIVQPAVIGDGDLLISSMTFTGGIGTRRLTVRHGSEGWSVTERWTSNALKPYFNDYVIHKGYAFGFDGNILASVDLADGARKWKGGRYGSGQLILLADQDLLLVQSEEGELALVSATPDTFTEIARAPALEGKTWNHPVLVGDVLLVRNGEEMAAFRLARAR